MVCDGAVAQPTASRCPEARAAWLERQRPLWRGTEVSPSPCPALPRVRAVLTSPAWGQPHPALSPTLFFPIRKDALFQTAHQPARKINRRRHWLRDEDPHPPVITIISTLKAKEQFSQCLQIALLRLWSISFLSAPSDDIDANKWQRRRWRERPMY